MSPRCATVSCAILLAACATPPGNADIDARNRPLEERCARLQPARSPTAPGLTREQVQAEARAAARRGEMDAACNWY